MIKRISISWVLVCIILGSNLNAQDTSVVNKQGFTPRQKWIIGGLVAQQAASFYIEYKWWWQHNYHPFNVEKAPAFNNYSLGLDKVGHFYTSYMYSNVLYEVMKWGKFKESTAEWVSLALPFAWALSIEIGDGYSDYGFDPKDLLANTLGIGYAFAQRKVPYLNNFKFKFSYFPSQFYRDRNYAGWSLTADYDGHIYWLTADVNNLLPKHAKRFWPKYLNLGFGYGITNFRPQDPSIPYVPMVRDYHIGLDYNLSRIPAKKEGWQGIRNIVDYYHFPAPGFTKRGNESWKFYPLLLN